MFGFIKNLFGGIFGFLGRLFGFNKSEYVLEFDSGSGTVPAAKTQPAQPAAPSATAKAEPAPAGPAQSAAPAKESKPQPPKAAEPVGGFATSYLISTSTSTRRRPGANMNSFLDMANQVKTAR